MKIKDVKVGDKVQVKERIEGWYSRYRVPDFPEFWLETDMVGTVGQVKVPYVSNRYSHGDYFVCVDFFSPVTGIVERVGVDYKNLKKA